MISLGDIKNNSKMRLVFALDMASLFEERRVIVACAFFGLWIVAIVMNYLDRDIFFTPQSSQWLTADVILLAA